MDWRTKKFGDIRRMIMKICKAYKIEIFEFVLRGPSSLECGLSCQLTDRLHKEDVMAKQQSRVNWLRAKTKFVV